MSDDNTQHGTIPTENDLAADPPTCSTCEIEMELRNEGTMKTIPVIGREVEFRQFNCPRCGQGARFERSAPDEEWTRSIQ
ncbi:hypothetical protein [Halopiger xanaduensis]|uniref:Uncharacterized protein n=1 Tax=Halopiger xanaduensis (strain DSM 18323 / JCM 14033 / SH-6) TaxID=797210 RepID=F8D2V4_HALXS|nr:hypothetical protein [Halopiger xanaduensis]AEH36097.1 hypothetical protein Halxa_1464 [Halopiger xanaduensis SH-6]